MKLNVLFGVWQVDINLPRSIEWGQYQARTALNLSKVLFKNES